MTLDYSSVVMVEQVVPEKGADSFTAVMDLTLMALLSSKERTKKNHEELADHAGLRVRRIIMLPNGSDGAIEMVLKGDTRL